MRRKEFTVRFRGLDHNEVRGFLNALADDIARLYDQITSLTQDNARLRNDLQQAQVAEPQETVTDQAVLLLNQAQQLADALIDEGMQSARDMMVAARTHQRVIVDPNGEIDPGAVFPARQRPTSPPATTQEWHPRSRKPGCSRRWRRCSSGRCWTR